MNAEIDPLQNDGRMLQTALQRAGVTVERRLYEGVTHEFFGMNLVLPEARSAQEFGNGALRNALK